MTLYNFNDAWAMIWNDTKPLVGKIEFCEANTTSLKTIYTVDGQELSNPIYCNGITTSQVMLADGDYTVRFYEYIGHGNMESDYNEDSWRLYKTELVKQNILNGGNDTTGVYATITTIEQLKELEVPSDGSVVGVVGYYTAEDCPLRYYVWHESGNYVDDGGIVIKSNNVSNGAWVMKIPYNYIDVRWYGDIPSNLVSAPSSNLGQRTKAATAANKYRKDLYFPSYAKGSETGFYMFDGSNTVSVDKDIIVDNAVRFVVKHGTEGTQVTCHELKACEKYLFVSELNQTIGGYSITADTIHTAWYSSDKSVAAGARVKYVIDRMSSPLAFTDAYVELASNITQKVTFDNCHIDGYKKLAGQVEMSNMLIKTDWFVDDYDWTNLSLTNCQIELENCKDANTYILLKTKQNDPNYGDLGEQSVNATVLPGGTIENCYGTITVNGSGNLELHNVSLTINGLTSANSINAIDAWMVFNSNITLGSLQLRRGALQGAGVIQLVGDSLIDGADINNPINCQGIEMTIRNSSIYGYITATNINLINNQIYNEVSQTDVNGVITINCVSNMFHNTSLNAPARHYIHATTADSVVNGIWAKNGSSYDTVHWIRLDRTNLKYEDRDHSYTYTGNSEPYLMKWSGRNHPMQFYKYSGYRVDSSRGAGIFFTTTIPFVFFNLRTRMITVVNRQQYWKMFTVGQGLLMRSGHIGSNDLAFGIMEGDYRDYKCGDVAIHWIWGSSTRRISSEDTTPIGYPQCVSLDGTGEADYNVSFELPDTDHTQGEYSQGVEIGNYPSSEWGSSHPTEHWAVYPDTIYREIATLCVYIDPDFSTANNPQTL